MVWDYSDKVKDLFLKAVNHSKDSHIGTLENPDGEGFHGSLVCGDAIKIMFKVKKHPNDPTKDIITTIRYQTFGCTSAIASSEALAIMLENSNMTPIKALDITKEDVINFLNGLPTQKIHCSIMGLEALEKAIINWAEKRNIPLNSIKPKLKYITPEEENKEDPEENKIICECLGLTKGYIKEQIINYNLKSVDEIMEKTKAGTVCGTCVYKKGGLRDILLETKKNDIVLETLEKYQSKKEA